MTIARMLPLHQFSRIKTTIFRSHRFGCLIATSSKSLLYEVSQLLITRICKLLNGAKSSHSQTIFGVPNAPPQVKMRSSTLT